MRKRPLNVAVLKVAEFFAALSPNDDTVVENASCPYILMSEGQDYCNSPKRDCTLINERTMKNPGPNDPRTERRLSYAETALFCRKDYKKCVFS